MNERDSETLAGLLEAAGYALASAPAEADVILINTCAVRRESRRRRSSPCSAKWRSTSAAGPSVECAGAVAQTSGELIARARRG